MDKGSIFILSYFKTLNIGPVPEIEPVLQASAPNNWVNPAAVREILPFTCDAFRVSWRVYRSLCCWGASGDSARQHKTRLWPQHDCSLFLVISFSQIEIKIFPLFAIWPPDVRDIVSCSQYRLTFVGAHCARLRGHKIRRGECEERSPPQPFSPPHSTHTLSWEHRFNQGFKLGTYTVNTWSSNSE